MNEILIVSGGFYTLVLIIFHLLFWRVFNWPETLMLLNDTNRATMQVLNISITFIFLPRQKNLWAVSGTGNAPSA